MKQWDMLHDLGLQWRFSRDQRDPSLLLAESDNVLLAFAVKPERAGKMDWHGQRRIAVEYITQEQAKRWESISPTTQDVVEPDTTTSATATDSSSEPRQE